MYRLLFIYIVIFDNALHSNLLKYSYKGGKMSKHKLLDAMSENSILAQIVSFENSSFEKNSTGIDEASDDINEQQSVHDLINKKDQRLEKKLIFFSRSTSAKA
jgi:hypothetical protein